MLRTRALGCLFGTLDAEIWRIHFTITGGTESYPARQNDVVLGYFGVGSAPCEVKTTERIRSSRGALLGGGVGTKRVTRGDNLDQYM